VILGKTNMSEWGYMRSTRGCSGWSSRGGQVRNPYALDRSPSGSSSGSATAVAASLCAAAVGTETDGSITSPSSVQALVGIKPTVGLLSRDGIVPISFTQDTPGPMCRSVRDAALLLAAMAGSDARDGATRDAAKQMQAMTLERLDAQALRARVEGVLHQLLDDRGRALHHLAGGDLADEQVGEGLDGGHRGRAIIASPAPALRFAAGRVLSRYAQRSLIAHSGHFGARARHV